MKNFFAIFCVIFTIFFSMSVLAEQNVYEYATYFGPILHITQGYGPGTYSHVGMKAMDLGGDTGWFYAPFTGTIERIRTQTNSFWFVSSNKVYYADGSLDYMTIRLVHMNDEEFEKLGIEQGKLFKQGEPLYHEGTKGEVTGSHIHLECAKGKTTSWHDTGYKGYWTIGKDASVMYAPNEALFVSKNTKISKSGGYNWKLIDEINTDIDGYLYYFHSDPDNYKYIRESPSSDSELIGGIPNGNYAVVTEYSSDGKWCYLNFHGVQGWTMLAPNWMSNEGAYICPIVTFDANGGNVSTASKKVYIGANYGTLPIPSKSGSDFNGWYTQANGGMRITSDSVVTITSDQTLYAQWNHTHSWTSDYEAAHPHKVFNRCRTCGETEYTGGTKKLDNCELCHEHTYGSEMYTSEHPHTMYKICTSCGEVLYPWPYKTQKNDDCEECYPHEHNWNYNNDSAHPHKEYRYCSCGEKEYTGNTNNVKNCEQCNPITRVTVFYNANGGNEAPSPKTVNSGDKVTVSSEKLSRSGYKFLGWSENANAVSPSYIGGDKITLNGDKTLYAVWSKKDDTSKQIILTIGSTKATVFGQTAYNDVAPILENSRTMLPARFVAENLGAGVSWNDDTQMVTIQKGDIYIQITIGSDTAYVNGEPVYLDSPAFLRNSRTYTPVRFICESLGAKVDWDDAKQQVIITK